MRRSLALLLLTGSLALGGCSRLAGLPEVPADLTAEETGVAGLDHCAAVASQLVRPLDPDEAAAFEAAPPDDPFEKARWALHLWSAERDGAGALQWFGEAVVAEPTDLVLGNRYRMLVYEMKRSFFDEARREGRRNPELPEHLSEVPFALLEAVADSDPGREIELQIALAYVDRMILYPALEIKAPASIDSVRRLSAILDGGDPHYIPALFARGLNYLHRPRNLVWPEKPAPAPDAASRDLGLAAAAGAKVGGAPPRLRAIVLITLGDAYAREGHPGVARSWWAAARELVDSPDLLESIALRMSWPDGQVADRLEAHLATQMADRLHPASDLSFLWSDGS